MKQPETMKPETTKQLVIPGVPLKTVRAYQKRAEANDRSLAYELRKALDAALKLARGGGGNRTRSSSLHLAAA